MVKNNIVIKINDAIVDYDDDTAIAITYSSYDPSKIDSIFLTGTNDFSLPITMNNKKIFEFAENTNSHPNSVYDKMVCYIYLDGIKVLNGNCNLTSVDSRYNVQFVEGKNVFDKLASLPFLRLQGDEYPISLVSKIVDDWNTTVLPYLLQTYHPTTSKAILDAILTYTNENYEGIPVRDYVIPIVKNLFAEKQYHYNNDYGIDEIQNNLFYNGTSKEGYGFVLGKYFTSSGLAETTAPLKDWEAGGSVSELINIRYGQTLLSPFWVSINKIVDLLEEYTGYQLNGLVESIEELRTGRLFMHIPAMELSSDFHFYTTPMADDWKYENGELTMSGLCNVLKGNKSWYGYRFDGNTNDVYDSDFKDLSCLDLIKTLIQEYNLTVDINEQEKRLVFKRIASIENANAKELTLVSEENKKFYIENISQLQTIKYSSVQNGAKPLNRTIFCENKNIDEGGEDKTLLTIERNICSREDYVWKLNNQTGYSMGILTVNNESNTKSFVFGYPSVSTKTGSMANEDIKSVCLSMTWKWNGESYPSTKKPSNLSPSHFEMALYSSNNLECMKAGNYINYVEQFTVGESDAYRYFQEIVRKPVYEEVTVLKDYKLLHNWQTLTKTHINGLAGNWYIKEISEFNPRTDDKMSLKIIKLPND